LIGEPLNIPLDLQE